MFTTPTLSIAEESMTVVGVGVLKSLVRLMREPVTVISSRLAAVAVGWSAGLSCAWATVLKLSTRAAAQRPRVSCLGRFVSFGFELLTAARTAASIAGRITVISGPLPRERFCRSVNVQAGFVLHRSYGVGLHQVWLEKVTKVSRIGGKVLVAFWKRCAGATLPCLTIRGRQQSVPLLCKRSKR